MVTATRLVLVLSLFVTTACRVVRDPSRCNAQNDCLESGYVCDFSASKPGEVGTCVPAGDAAAPDASAPDASAADAAALDGGPDAAPLPPLTNGQSAELSLGQIDLISSSGDAGLSGANLRAPHSVAAPNASVLFVGESLRARVLAWSLAEPAQSGTSAVAAFGQSDLFTANTNQPTSSSTFSGLGVLRVDFGANRTFVSDAGNCRVLVWVGTPLGQPAANIVIGQALFDTGACGAGAGQLDQPSGVWSDGTRLAVADTRNNRVLIWTSFPATSGAPAQLVLGQAGFGVRLTSPVSAASMNGPKDVTFDGARFFVADTQNNRVLGWNGFPTASGQPADFVLGQTGFLSGAPNPDFEPTARSLSSPQALASASGSLFVGDAGNNRVVVYTPTPSATGAAAGAVVGQRDLVSGDLDLAVAKPDRLNSPLDIAIAGNRLYVADTGWHRVVRFALRP